jgi:hypothetical protein
MLREVMAMGEMKQVKIYVEPELAATFATLCRAGGVSVTAELSGYMRKRTGRREPSTASGIHTDVRRQRKAAMRHAVTLLEKIRDDEGAYFEAMPESLKASELGEDAEQTVNRINDALDALGEAFTV